MATTTYTSYEQAHEQHRWNVPARYNIAVDACDSHPREKLAMIHEHFRGRIREVRWGELQDDSNRFANVLRSHGVERGDRVALTLPPTPETAAAFFGVWKAGAILLSMSVLYGDEGIRHRVHDSQPKGAADQRRERRPSRARSRRAPADPRRRAAGTRLDLVPGRGHGGRRPICPLLGPWRLGATQVVYQREGGFDPHKQLDFLNRHRVRNVFGTPTAIRSMMSITDAASGTRRSSGSSARPASR